MGCSIQKSKTIKQNNVQEENPITDQPKQLQLNNGQDNHFIISSIMQRRRFLLNTIPKLNLSSNDLYKRRKFRQLAPNF